MAKFYRGIARPIRKTIRKLRSVITQKDHVSERNIRPLSYKNLNLLENSYTKSIGQDVDDFEIVERILNSYRLHHNVASHPSDMWAHINEKYHGELNKIFLSGSHEQVASALRRPGDSDLFYGFDGLSVSVAKAAGDNRYTKRLGAALVVDKLIRVAEVIGALRLENPENDKFSNSSKSVEEILSAIDRKLGIRVDFPNPFPDEFGVPTSRGIAGDRSVQAIYQAWRIRELTKYVASPRIVEIGGGLGRTAYYAWQLGIHDYTIIDLPFTGLSQAYFLMRCLGSEHVSIHGETLNQNNDCVKLHRPDAFLNGAEKYDLVVNVDSLTEIGVETAGNYWRKISTSTPIFLSINHEINTYTVSEVAENAPVNPMVKERYPYGIRKGYAEEVFLFPQNRAPNTFSVSDRTGQVGS